ncbi:MAG TPA: hypothetical protein VF690_10665 [Hymenobacter sp.]|jgi:hypothetical protein
MKKPVSNQPESTSADHLELVFLASTLTPALQTGWNLSLTPAPRLRPTPLAAAPPVVRLAVVEC